MRKLFWLSALVLPVAGLRAQQMPYPVAYTYVAMAESGDGWSATATSVANTNCTSGHTLPVVAVTVHNPDRTRSAFASGDYSPYCYGQATAYLPLCLGEVCEDGLFTADSEGTTEYCPVTFAFLAAAAAVASFVEPAFITIHSAEWQPPGPLATQNGLSRFYVKALKSKGCPATHVAIARQFDPFPSTVEFNVLPADPLTQGCTLSPFSCSVNWEVRTSPSNETGGSIEGFGTLASYTPGSCSVKDFYKAATIQVQSPSGGGSKGGKAP